MKKTALAFDIGGTQVKAGIITKEGEILIKDAIDTNADGSTEELKEHLVSFANELYSKIDSSQYEISAVGFGAPGLIGEDTVVLGGCENIRSLTSMRFADIGDAFDVETRADNDATVAALGEAVYGAGKGYKVVLLATLGTGVGGGIVIDGKPFRGAFGYAGEFGHMCINTAGLQCNCGSYGCIEQYASATGLVNRAKQKIYHKLETSLSIEQLEKEKAKAVFDAAREGDAVASEIIREVGHYLGIGFSAAVNLLNPDLILVGGGMSKGADLLIPHIKSYMKNYTLPLAFDGIKIEVASLGNDAGILGSAALAFDTR